MSVLEKKWEFIGGGSHKGIEYRCEDDAIFTTDGEEVLGCSEWMRCDEETMEHIIDLHNATLNT